MANWIFNVGQVSLSNYCDNYEIKPKKLGNSSSEKNNELNLYYIYILYLYLYFYYRVPTNLNKKMENIYN